MWYYIINPRGKRKEFKMSRTFFSRTKAESFAEILKAQGFESVKIWMDMDGFKQTIYIVKWY